MLVMSVISSISMKAMQLQQPEDAPVAVVPELAQVREDRKKTAKAPK